MTDTPPESRKLASEASHTGKHQASPSSFVSSSSSLESEGVTKLAQEEMALQGHRRPLSPHLTIYKPSMTMVMSIFHRLTGGALYLGTLLLVWWLLALASGEEAFETVSAVFHSLLGQVILFGFSWALFHHMLGGIRHLIWDTGVGFDRESRFFLARLTLIGSVVLTLLFWGVALLLRLVA